MRSPHLIFEDALDAFLSKEGTQLLSDVSERSTCGRIALYLERQLEKEGVSDYYADTEYNRMHGGYVKTIIDDEQRVFHITSDLIVNTRGEKLPPHDNLIAVEAKKAARPDEDKRDDRKRLRVMTRPVGEVQSWGGHPKHVCGYTLGVFLHIDAEKRRIGLEYFRSGIASETRNRDF